MRQHNKYIEKSGYAFIWKPNHLNAKKSGYIREHRFIASEILGKPLSKNAAVHHINNNHADNQHSNLIICENTAYHQILHERQKALKACGQANWRKCVFCKGYDELKNLRISSNRGHAYHARCNRRYYRSRRRRLSLLKSLSSTQLAGVTSGATL